MIYLVPLKSAGVGTGLALMWTGIALSWRLHSPGEVSVQDKHHVSFRHALQQSADFTRATSPIP
jgi:hypothetical protein